MGTSPGLCNLRVEVKCLSSQGGLCNLRVEVRYQLNLGQVVHKCHLSLGLLVVQVEPTPSQTARGWASGPKFIPKGWRDVGGW
jgi:hypothetical protein